MGSRKKQDYISWDEYFMGVAQCCPACAPKIPNTQVGCMYCKSG